MNSFDALLSYHEAEMKLTALEKEIVTSPARVRLNKLRGILTEQQKLLSNIQKQVDAKNKSFEELAAMADEFEHAFELEKSDLDLMMEDEECTAAEMSEARRSLEALLSKITAVRKELYDTIAWLDRAAAEAKAIYSMGAKANKEYNLIYKQCEDEFEKAKPDIEAAKAEADTREKGVAPELVKRYKTIRKKHAVPLAKLEGERCGGCNMSLPTTVVRSVVSGTEIVECENCGRILYSNA